MSTAFRWTLLAVLLASLAGPRALAAEEPDPARLLGMVQAYLTMLDHMHEITSDPRRALLLAQNSIKEVYEQRGQKAEAIPELRRMLDGVDDPAVRTAVRFAIADIYKETGQRDRALEELRQIVAENKGLLARKK